MTGVELIVAALAAGAGAGTSAAAVDAYTGLRDALRRRLTGRREAKQSLDAAETDPEVWDRRIGADLANSGADTDEQVLAAANRLLELVDPEGVLAGKYAVDLPSVQVGNSTLRIDTVYGPTAGVMTGPVSVSYGQLPLPPARPEA